MPAEARPSPLSLAVLGLLCGGSLHPYRMQQLIKRWGKDQVINVGQRSSLYKTIKRLNELGLIAIRDTERAEAYPERTVYELTPEGRRVVLEWLEEMLSTPRNEFPQFPAALSFAMLLGPAGTLASLESRAESLQHGLDNLDAALERDARHLPRVTLLETEYQRAAAAAELAWTNGIVDDLRAGVLSWSEQDFARVDPAYLTDEPTSAGEA